MTTEKKECFQTMKYAYPWWWRCSMKRKSWKQIFKAVRTTGEVTNEMQLTHSPVYTGWHVTYDKLRYLENVISSQHLNQNKLIVLILNCKIVFFLAVVLTNNFANWVAMKYTITPQHRSKYHITGRADGTMDYQRGPADILNVVQVPCSLACGIFKSMLSLWALHSKWWPTQLQKNQRSAFFLMAQVLDKYSVVDLLRMNISSQ